MYVRRTLWIFTAQLGFAQAHKRKKKNSPSKVDRRTILGHYFLKGQYSSVEVLPGTLCRVILQHQREQYSTVLALETNYMKRVASCLRSFLCGIIVNLCDVSATTLSRYIRCVYICMPVRMHQRGSKHSAILAHQATRHACVCSPGLAVSGGQSLS